MDLIAVRRECSTHSVFTASCWGWRGCLFHCLVGHLDEMGLDAVLGLQIRSEEDDRRPLDEYRHVKKACNTTDLNEHLRPLAFAGAICVHRRAENMNDV